MSRTDHLFQFQIPPLGKMLSIRRDWLANMLIWPKESVARWSLYIGIIICYISSLKPWFLWSIDNYCIIIALPLFLLALLINQRLREPLLRRNAVLISTVLFVSISLSMGILGNYNMLGVGLMLLQTPIFYAILRLDRTELIKISDVLSIMMACLMCISIPAFVYHLAGGNLPHTFVYNEKLQYTFDNYYFFMINDSNERIIPRFHAFFLEPGHLGTACTFLLLTQIGRWKKWYNLILIFTSIITLSLAAYVLMAMTCVFSLWIRKRKVLIKLLVTGGLFAGFIIGAKVYNDGVNVVNMLIVERLALDESGKMTGDNRTSDEFTKEFDRYISSGEVLTGGPIPMGKFPWGNAGYRVFVYSYGIITTLLVAIFALSVTQGAHTRPKWAMYIIGVASFWVRATPFYYYYFIPLYMLAHIGWRNDPDYATAQDGESALLLK
ncbi:MAG: hypothetical protein ACI4B5_02435 [Bacteroidaceae bacterium]